MIWENIISKNFADIDSFTPVVLNIAAIEQHGPALPVATDSVIGKHFLNRLEAAISQEILILPQIAVCCSDHHLAFAGTLSVSHRTLMRYCNEILCSVYAHGFKNFILFNSHGGNLGIGQVVLEEFGAAHPDANIVLATWWKLIPQELSNLQTSPKGGVGHACEFEHSLMQLIAPELIDDSVDLNDETLYAAFPWAAADLLHAPEAQLYRSFERLTANGIYGKPAFASKAKGLVITEAVTQKLMTLVRDLRSLKPAA